MSATHSSWKPTANLLDQRVILITGAGDGIGAAVSLACAAHGATVILLGKTIPKLEAVYDRIELQGGPKPGIYPLDLQGATWADYVEFADTLNREFGRLDGLVHNAAQLGALSPVEHYDPELWYRVMQVNLHAPFLLTRACLALLKQSADGSIVFCADAVGREAKAYWGAYGVSKRALAGFAGTLAAELESNTSVRVNQVDPGAVRTNLRLLAFPAEDRSKLVQPAEITDPFLYLLGPDSRGINGQCLQAQCPDWNLPPA